MAIKFNIKKILPFATLGIGIIALLMYFSCGTSLFSIATNVGGSGSGGKMVSYYDDLTLRNNSTLTLNNVYHYIDSSTSLCNGQVDYMFYVGFIKAFVYLNNELIYENGAYVDVGTYTREDVKKWSLNLTKYNLKNGNYNLTTIYYISPLMLTRTTVCGSRNYMCCTDYGAVGCVGTRWDDDKSKMYNDCQGYFSTRSQQTVACGNQSYIIHACNGWQNIGVFNSKFYHCDYLNSVYTTSGTYELSPADNNILTKATPKQMDILVNLSKLYKFTDNSTLVIYGEASTTPNQTQTTNQTQTYDNDNQTATTVDVAINEKGVAVHSKICDYTWIALVLFILMLIGTIYFNRKRM
ncbi:MAG: hypothetical protein CVU81_01100 [Euryarchaeota archaeon HGW-Euryarchaeota-1]|nr:MAG: hypothetical protein CVU81_01100 [Euryarchaeota archaeon HGW-Euryarchaeota-1]